MPYSRARSIAMRIASGPITPPCAPSESIVQAAGLSWVMRHCGSRLMVPSRIDSTYLRSMFETPCESIPRMSA